ncbi:hypothetical protein JCM14469_32420 [Desulfatiferula olefinivorans]
MIGLINNAALLLALGLLYDMSRPDRHDEQGFLKRLSVGVVLGLIGMAIMLNPWDFGQGVVFDTRSVLLCVGGFFFGLLPSAVAMAMTGAFRLSQGGAGAWTGVAVILSSGAIGLIWGHVRRVRRHQTSSQELYLMGLAVHAVMLAWMLTLPRDVAMGVLSRISLPVMIIYPLATSALGTLMVNRWKHRRASSELLKSEQVFRHLFENHSAVKLLVDPETGRIIEANNAAEIFYGWPVDQLRSMNIKEINTLSKDRIKEMMVKARLDGRTYFEFIHRLSDGSLRDVEVYSSPVTVDGREVLHSIIHDITDRKRAERELQSRQAVLNLTQSLAKIGGWEWKKADGAMSWTDEVYRIHDLDPDQFDPKSPEHIAKSLECYDPDDRDRIRKAFDRCANHGEPYDFELPFTTVAGRRLWVRTTARALWNEGRIERVVGNIMDITERRRAEEHRAESLDLLTNLARMVPGVIYQFRLYPDGRSAFPYASPGIYDIYELFPDDVREDATPAYGRIHPEDHDRVVADIKASAETLGHFQCEFRVILPTQGLRWRWSQGHPERLPDGSTLWHGIIMDATDHKRSEQALAHTHDLMRYIIEHNRSAIAVFDKDLRYIYVSQRYLSDFRITDESIVGRHHYDVFPDLPQKWKDAHRRVLAGNVEQGQEDRLDRPDGTVDWSQWECRPWFEADGAIGGIILYIEIITERKKLETQLLQAQKMESVGRLAGGVAHDYNNMLGVIIGYTELLLDKLEPDSELREDLNEIFMAARRSADITRQLLAFSRQQPIAPQRLDLNDTVESMLKMLRRLIGEDIDLVWRPGPRLFPVYMDPIQVDQILVNLCVNARDAIDDVGRIVIETASMSFDAAYCAQHADVLPGDYVVLAVSDDGCGMDGGTRDMVFEPFYTTKAAGKGTGLGLATVYGIVKQNRGFITIYSEPGQGTVFRIYLPRNKAHEDKALKARKAEKESGGSETLLLVEDDPALLRMTSMMLERQGYLLLKASTPDEAIGLARGHDGMIPLLITDVIMPGMNGRELADQIRSIKPEVTVLFMSGYTASVIADRRILDDGLNFLQKPFTKKELAAKVRESLDRT